MLLIFLIAAMLDEARSLPGVESRSGDAPPESRKTPRPGQQPGTYG